MNIWRLIAHHEEPLLAIEDMKRRNRIAIGWTGIGDLRELNIEAPTDITRRIADTYPEARNAHLGGPSLWSLFREMQEGDLVVIKAKSRRICVFEVSGPYFFAAESQQIKDYGHMRAACLTSIDPNEILGGLRNPIERGQNSRWTLVRCVKSDVAERIAFREGARHSVVSTSIERNPAAREECLRYYGNSCSVCAFNFEDTYGELGKNYIHVHHKYDISLQEIEYKVDPINDLVPLCPNCHAMIHKTRPAMSVEELKNIMNSRPVCLA